MPATREITIEVHSEDGTFWATVAEFPGLFATGDTEPELFENVAEGLRVYLSEDGTVVRRVTLDDPAPTPGVRTVRKTLLSA
ncbi:type II toxin-antitoxin system HicB family antitoxin [Patulibacter sp. NPDC049589]|uniref:type II toxin-antitoxin system HicB family antitoxin n=1 Tax=Patulibacter sp. NPDC049589 TaxID=3154731 RepID=UPI0034256FAA